MSVLSKLKKLFKKKEKKKKKKEDKNKSEKETVESVDEHVEENIGIDGTKSAINSWEETLEAAKQHPLSQAKILNTKILEELNHVLNQMNAKLDKLEKLDQILRILIETKEELEEKGVETTALDKAIEEVEKLTIKDKEVVAWVEKQGKTTAKELAKHLNLSRSTASFRLNRLADMDVLQKEAVGRKVYYKTKSI